jgi:hypothetical protein
MQLGKPVTVYSFIMCKGFSFRNPNPGPHLSFYPEFFGGHNYQYACSTNIAWSCRLYWEEMT